MYLRRSKDTKPSVVSRSFTHACHRALSRAFPLGVRGKHSNVRDKTRFSRRTSAHFFARGAGVIRDAFDARTISLRTV
jgi:hypothetical protein